MRTPRYFDLNALLQLFPDAEKGDAHPFDATPEFLSEFFSREPTAIAFLDQTAHRFGKLRHTFLEKDGFVPGGCVLGPAGELGELRLLETGKVHLFAGEPEQFFANQIPSDGAQPGAEGMTAVELGNVAESEDKRLVGNLIREMRHGEFEGNKGPKGGKMTPNDGGKCFKVAGLHTTEQVRVIRLFRSGSRGRAHRSGFIA